MNSYKIYIFDLDDTLINTISHVHEVIYPTLARQTGLEYKGWAVLKKYWGVPFDISLKKIFHGQVDVDCAIQALVSLHEKYPVPFQPGVKKIFQILKKHQKFIGLFSSGIPEIFKFYMERINTLSDKTLDFSISTFNVEKQHAGIISVATESFKKAHASSVKPEEIVLIGDSADDFNAAHKAGVEFAGLLSGNYTKNDFLRIGCADDQIFKNIKEALTPEREHGVVALIRNDKDQYLFIEEGRPDNPFFGCWSGPHGRTKAEDIIEEETVCRETMEECNLNVMPIKKVFTRSADTKAKTVTFWQTQLMDSFVNLAFTSPEVSRIKWVSKQEIVNKKLRLYPGTQDFIFNYQQVKE